MHVNNNVNGFVCLFSLWSIIDVIFVQWLLRSRTFDSRLLKVHSSSSNWVLHFCFFVAVERYSCSRSPFNCVTFLKRHMPFTYSHSVYGPKWWLSSQPVLQMSSARAHASCGDNLQDNSIRIELLSNGAAEGRREVADRVGSLPNHANQMTTLISSKWRAEKAEKAEHNSLISLHEIRIVQFLWINSLLSSRMSEFIAMICSVINCVCALFI